MKLNTDSFVGVGICILGLLGVGYAIRLFQDEGGM